METPCKNEQKNGQACIPFFVAENQLMHMDTANRRLLVALVSVCATFVLTIIIFVCGYTVREQNWLDTIKRIAPQTEVTDAERQSP